MKTTGLVLLSLMISLSAHCQDTKDYSVKRNEINLGYFNAFNLSSIGELGVGYKRISEKGAFRIGLGTDIWSSKTEYEDYETKISGYKLSPRMGYEFHQWYNRIRLNYGIDVVGSFGSSNYENLYNDPAENYTRNSKSLSAGIRPLLGLTVYLNPSISISTETYMDIAFNRSSTEWSHGGSPSMEESRGMNVGLGPLGIIAVNFHF